MYSDFIQNLHRVDSDGNSTHSVELSQGAKLKKKLKIKKLLDVSKGKMTTTRDTRSQSLLNKSLSSEESVES